MTTWMLILLIGVVFHRLYRLESKEAQEDALVDELVKESRRSKPRMERNPARFGTVGYRMPVRRRSWRSLI